MNIKEKLYIMKQLFLKETGGSATGTSMFKRGQLLQDILDLLENNMKELIESLKLDLQTSRHAQWALKFDIFRDIHYSLDNFQSWLGQEKTFLKNILENPLLSAYHEKRPYGVVLVIGSELTSLVTVLNSVIAALLAGNRVILLPPSDLSHFFQMFSEKLATYKHLSEYLHCLIEIANNSKIEETLSSLLDSSYKWDFIDFHGPATLCKTVAKLASSNLTPINLDIANLRSVAIIDKFSDIEMAAKRIIYGKFIYGNAGQDPRGPDFVCVHKHQIEKFLEHLKKYLTQFLGEINGKLEYGEYYQKGIQNQENFDQLVDILKTAVNKQDNLYLGGEFHEDSKFIEPTILKNVRMDSAIMTKLLDDSYAAKGPLLPVMTYQEPKALFEELRASFGSFLGMFIFTNREEFSSYAMDHSVAGCFCINDTITETFPMDLAIAGNRGYSNLVRGKDAVSKFSRNVVVIGHTNSFMTSVSDIGRTYPPISERKVQWLRLLNLRVPFPFIGALLLTGFLGYIAHSLYHRDAEINGVDNTKETE